MKLDQLKEQLLAAHQARMKHIYERIQRMAKDNCCQVNFEHTTEHDNSNEYHINEVQMKQLEKDGYTVDWRDETVSVSGWENE